MKDFLKELARWWDDPMTEALFAAAGALIVLEGISRAHIRARRLEERVTALELDGGKRAHA